MMIKIVATINDAAMAANVGGPVESVSEIIEIPTRNLPANFMAYLVERQETKTKGGYSYKSVSFSLLEDQA